MIRREKIKLITGVPMILGVENLRGTDTTSSFTGDETRFEVRKQDGTPSHLYLPRAYAGAIAASGAHPGDEIQVLKTGVNGQTPTYRLQVVSDAALTAPPLPPQNGNGYHDQPPQGIRMLAPRTQVAPQSVPAATPAHASGTAVLLAQCLHCAIDAAIGAEAFAAKKDRTLLFSEEDIRAMALTIYIGKQKEGR